MRELRVDYGNFMAVDDLSFTVPLGEVCGLVGPNLAGKTSAFKVAGHAHSSHLRQSKMYLFEEAEAGREVPEYMPGFAPVPSDPRVWKFMDSFAHAQSIENRARRHERVGYCLGTCI